MGAAEMISVLLTNSVAAGNLALAYATYRKAYPRSPKATIKIEGQGISIELPADPDEAADILVKAVEAHAAARRAQSASDQAPAPRGD